MNCSKCLFCNLKARSNCSSRLSWTFTAWLSEKKGKLQDDWGLEERCNFTNYPTHWSGVLSPPPPTGLAVSNKIQRASEKETGFGWNIMGVIKFRLSLFGTNWELITPIWTTRSQYKAVSYVTVLQLEVLPHWEEFSQFQVFSKIYSLSNKSKWGL